MPVVELLAPMAGERILDLGCGDGALTLKLKALGVDVKGVDASAEQIAAARAAGLDAEVVDGHALEFNREFDAVFSNAALHWMQRPVEVIDGVRRALKPGGRFVGEMGGFTNVSTLILAILAALKLRGIDGRAAHPWYFPTPAAYGTLLQAAGFAVETIDLIPRLTPLPGSLVEWLDTFADSLLTLVAPSERAALKQEVSDLAEPLMTDENGNWMADYVRLRFKAILK